MKTILVLFPIVILATFYAVLCVLHAASIRLAGRILGGVVVGWQTSFIFASWITMLMLLEQFATTATGISMPLAVKRVLGVTIYLTIGGWYFCGRGTNKNGQPLRWVSSVSLSTVALLMFVLIAAFTNEVTNALVASTKHV